MVININAGAKIQETFTLTVKTIYLMELHAGI